LIPYNWNPEVQGVQSIRAPFAAMPDADEARLRGIMRITGNPPATPIDIHSFQHLSQRS
jgi:hypothetical protein